MSETHPGFVHGDMLAVVDQTGVKQGSTYRWDPDAMPTGGSTQPDLLSGGFENGWLGQHFRPVDTTDPAIPVIEMGARPYVPSIGRFLSEHCVLQRAGICRRLVVSCEYGYIHNRLIDGVDQSLAVAAFTYDGAVV